eukprot:CAMPEP_0182420150 /NCGR_PEP_ID=MMETSP1167-20130531/4715_1 /TAXON_ID=2988 /ORGANISM="Mallomonas Sp, Strain CCMP3275" /LENGTH=157 /DNA_ID=CAMNT_0024595677 /DNA_START=60 /DNA_END=533 /DNA_ORIENTATION=-
MSGDDIKEAPCDSVMSTIAGGFGIGAMLGIMKSLYYQIPGSPSANPAIRYTEMANAMGKTSLNFALMATMFGAGACASHTFRGTDDVFNQTIGGSLVGAVLGLRRGKIHSVVMSMAFCGVLGTLSGFASKTYKTQEKDYPNVIMRKFQYLAKPESPV